LLNSSIKYSLLEFSSFILVFRLQDVRDPEREKRRIARKKEKRATLILGLIMGSFILCWLPFFFLYILEPLCPSCQVAPWGFAIAFWLGYMNSALNPGKCLVHSSFHSVDTFLLSPNSESTNSSDSSSTNL
jgi:hypothetical protein